MVWILRFMSAKTVFSLYTHPAAKKKQRHMEGIQPIKDGLIGIDMPYNDKDYAYPF